MATERDIFQAVLNNRHSTDDEKAIARAAIARLDAAAEPKPRAADVPKPPVPDPVTRPRGGVHVTPIRTPGSAIAPGFPGGRSTQEWLEFVKAQARRDREAAQAKQDAEAALVQASTPTEQRKTPLTEQAKQALREEGTHVLAAFRAQQDRWFTSLTVGLGNTAVVRGDRAEELALRQRFLAVKHWLNRAGEVAKEPEFQAALDTVRAWAKKELDDQKAAEKSQTFSVAVTSPAPQRDKDDLRFKDGLSQFVGY